MNFRKNASWKLPQSLRQEFCERTSVDTFALSDANEPPSGLSENRLRTLFPIHQKAFKFEIAINITNCSSGITEPNRAWSAKTRRQIYTHDRTLHARELKRTSYHSFQCQLN